MITNVSFIHSSMPKIHLQTLINADIETCFDLSRSIDLHQLSTAQTNEKAIDGVTSGLISMGEFVTWQAKHFGVTQKLTSKITAYNRPFHFRDEQQKGAFKYFRHDHFFEQQIDAVLMKDVFEFQSPFGLIGRTVDTLIMKNYLTRFLVRRNNVIKNFAESGRWKMVLQP